MSCFTTATSYALHSTRRVGKPLFWPHRKECGLNFTVRRDVFQVKRVSKFSQSAGTAMIKISCTYSQHTKPIMRYSVQFTHGL